MTTNDKEALREHLHAALDRLFTTAVQEASKCYREYLAGERGLAPPVRMSRHTLYHLPAVLHVRSLYRLDEKDAKLAGAWISWADVLTERYHHNHEGSP